MTLRVITIVGCLLSNREDRGSHPGTSIHFLDPLTEQIKVAAVSAVERQKHGWVNAVDVNLPYDLAMIRGKVLFTFQYLLVRSWKNELHVIGKQKRQNTPHLCYVFAQLLGFDHTARVMRVKIKQVIAYWGRKMIRCQV